MPFSLSLSVQGLLCSRLICFMVCTQQCAVLVNSNANWLSPYLSHNLPFFNFYREFLALELNKVCSGLLISLVYSLPAIAWLSNRDLRWWEVSCWLISMQPWTPLWASGPSRLLTELCAKDKTFLCCVQYDQDFFPFFFCCCQQYRFAINWLDVFPDLRTVVSDNGVEVWWFALVVQGLKQMILKSRHTFLLSSLYILGSYCCIIVMKHSNTCSIKMSSRFTKSEKKHHIPTAGWCLL